MKKRNIVLFLSLIICIFIIFIIGDESLKILTNFKTSLARTLFEENRYLLILRGTYNTLVLSFYSVIIGTIFGIVLCYMGKSKKATLNYFSRIFISIMQGTPITVLLLIFYYVVFGKVDINPMLVGILTFSIYFSAYVSEILSASFDSISKNQIIAAHSLGFNKFQTIWFIFLPQAISYILPTYKNEIVTLIKLTSIGGYISIIEITKSSDIIRNRTYEAFMPLIISAIIYYLICKLVSKILDFVHIKIDPRKKRVLV